MKRSVYQLGGWYTNLSVRTATDSKTEINRWYHTTAARYHIGTVLTARGGDLSTAFDTDKVVH